MVRRILIVGAGMAAAMAASLVAASNGVVATPFIPSQTPRRAREFDYPAAAKPVEPRNDVRQLRREQYARERRTRPVLPKGKGR